MYIMSHGPSMLHRPSVAGGRQPSAPPPKRVSVSEWPLSALLIFGLLFWALGLRRKPRRTRDPTLVEGSRHAHNDSREAKYQPELDRNRYGPVREIDGRRLNIGIR